VTDDERRVQASPDTAWLVDVDSVRVIKNEYNARHSARCSIWVDVVGPIPLRAFREFIASDRDKYRPEALAALEAPPAVSSEAQPLDAVLEETKGWFMKQEPTGQATFIEALGEGLWLQQDSLEPAVRQTILDFVEQLRTMASSSSSGISQFSQ
jgi:hypothetical protein